MKVGSVYDATQIKITKITNNQITYMENKLLDLESEGKKLKIYTFSVQHGPMMIEVAEDTKMILAYDDESAVNMVRKDYPMTQRLAIRKKATVPADRLIQKINLSQAAPIEVKQEPPPTPEMTEKSFVYGLMYAADKFVKNTRDKASLKRIAGSLIKKYESKKS